MEKKAKKPKLVKKFYTLKEEVTVKGKVRKAGNKIKLTEEGRAFLESIHKI